MAWRIASDTRLPVGCGLVHSSRFSILLSSRTPFLWWTFSDASSGLPRCSSMTILCSILRDSPSGDVMYRYPFVIFTPPFHDRQFDPFLSLNSTQVRQCFDLLPFGPPHFGHGPLFVSRSILRHGLHQNCLPRFVPLAKANKTIGRSLSHRLQCRRGVFSSHCGGGLPSAPPMAPFFLNLA